MKKYVNATHSEFEAMSVVFDLCQFAKRNISHLPGEKILINHWTFASENVEKY